MFTISECHGMKQNLKGHLNLMSFVKELVLKNGLKNDNYSREKGYSVSFWD